MTQTMPCVNLCSQEGSEFEVPIEVAQMSELIKTMIGDDGEEDEAPAAAKSIQDVSTKAVPAAVFGGLAKLGSSEA